MTLYSPTLPACLGLLLTFTAPAQGDGPQIPADTSPVTTDSGLQYSILAAGGDGPAPKLGDKVTVHYTGWLTDGKVFDSSRQRGAPATFALGQVIEGWNEGLTHVTVGGRIKLTIPAEIGYGERGSPPVIPAGATLVFDIELLGIQRAPDLPAFDREQATKTDSGLLYQRIKVGAGAVPTSDTPLELQFTVWNTEGRLIHDSGNMGGTRWTRPKDLRLGVLAEAAKLMKTGGEWLCEVPATLAFGDQTMPGLPGGSTSLWLLRLTRTFTQPEFAMPAADAGTKTDSGLRIVTAREGSGASPKMGEAVTVHYAGWLASGGEPFDASYGRGVSMSFQLGGVIQGWNEGLQQMQEGGAAWLLIPPELGYGQSGSPPKIPADATLLFYVELLKIGR